MMRTTLEYDNTIYCAIFAIDWKGRNHCPVRLRRDAYLAFLSEHTFEDPRPYRDAARQR